MNQKTILVTGANKGIGFEIVRQLAKKGHQVILTARDQSRGEAALKKLEAEGLKVHFLLMDVTNEKQIHEAVKHVKKEYKKLDVLINNAGILSKKDTSILDTEEKVLHDTIQTNSIAPLKITQAFVSIIPEGGRVIMMSSGGGSMSDPVGGWAPIYCSSKSFLNSITRQLAYALQEKNIYVNAMCPGWVRTDMGGSSASRSTEQGADTAVWLATHEEIPTGKFFRDRKVIEW